MLFKLNSIASMTVKYLTSRDGVFQYKRRVPKDLVEQYPTGTIRESLNTKDYKEALSKLKHVNAKYEREFETLRKDDSVTPAGVIEAAQAKARKLGYDLDAFITLIAEPAEDKWQSVRPEEEGIEYPPPSAKDILSPVDYEAWKIIAKDKDSRFTLYDALDLYFDLNSKSSNPKFQADARRTVSNFLKLVGNLQFSEIKRSHVRSFVNHERDRGLKTTSVRRALNSLHSIYATALREKELANQINPFDKITISGEGDDAKKRAPVPQELHLKILTEAWRNLSSSTSILTILQSELGTRIGEVSGAALEDLNLESDPPFIKIRPTPWRTIKTKDSVREIPLTELAIAALKTAVRMANNHESLFPQYQHPRGANSASAAVSKQLKKYNITSHQFRHSMADRLRDVDCPKDLRESILGHKTGDIAERYGSRGSLVKKKEFLDKCAFRIEQLETALRE